MVLQSAIHFLVRRSPRTDLILCLLLLQKMHAELPGVYYWEPSQRASDGALDYWVERERVGRLRKQGLPAEWTDVEVGAHALFCSESTSFDYRLRHGRRVSISTDRSRKEPALLTRLKGS
jgi:hypothetical protein